MHKNDDANIIKIIKKIKWFIIIFNEMIKIFKSTTFAK